ncbi:hypothetical protein LIER_29437 [Lithospermum erythrorhizon]|uniref:ENT domain-containing protein n=1 Tax=Lithospermum erythrorhizon TaxID=34254 RepID=A0AAV3RKX1_LITER
MDFISGGLVGAAPFQRINSDMESQIHFLEQEAYRAVLRAFKAQSDALSWEKEGLITELRKELRVSDDEHRDLLNKVNADDVIRRIREWRTAGCPVVSIPHSGHDQLHSPPVSVSRKKRKTNQPLTVPYGTGLHSLQTHSHAATQQPFSAANRGPATFSGGMKLKLGQQPFSYTTPMQYQTGPHGSSATPFMSDNGESNQDPFVGKKVMTRWPGDKNFYEAVIAEYNNLDGRHALVYDRHTPKETWEWVHLNEIPPADLRWIGDDPGVSRPGFNAGQSGIVDIPSAGRKSSRDLLVNEMPPSQNGVKKMFDNLEILHTDTLIEKIERVLNSNNPDLLEIQQAKKILKEHEQSLVDVIGKLADACDDGGGNETITGR